MTTHDLVLYAFAGGFVGALLGHFVGARWL